MYGTQPKAKRARRGGGEISEDMLVVHRVPIRVRFRLAVSPSTHVDFKAVC